MNGDATVFRNISLNGTISGCTGMTVSGKALTTGTHTVHSHLNMSGNTGLQNNLTVNGTFTCNGTLTNIYTKTETDTESATKQDVTTELTNLLSIFTVGGDSIGIKDPSPATVIASLDIDNGLIVRSLNINFNSEEPLIYLARGNRTGLDRHHRISGSTYHADATLSYLKFQIHDGSDTTGNTLVDTLKLDMNRDATILRNISLNGTMTGMTNIYTKSETDTELATKQSISSMSDYYTKTEINAQSLATLNNLALKQSIHAMSDYYTKTDIDTLIGVDGLIDTQYWSNGSTLLSFHNAGFSILGHCFVQGVHTVQDILRINGHMEHFTLNVGRGDVHFENNANDNANGAGLTIRTSSNPTTSSMFAVRSSGEACRFWVGQSITTPGDTIFHCGFIGSAGEENDTTKYKHKLAYNLAQFGTVTTWSSDDRLKDNEEIIESACETLNKLRPQTYDKKPSIGNDDPTTWIKESGLIAQEVYYDAPELRHLVRRDKETDEEGNPLPEIQTSIDPQHDPDYSSWGNEPASLNYIGLIAYLVKANN